MGAERVVEGPKRSRLVSAAGELLAVADRVPGTAV